jgi:uncharacterized membrane protein HdeD (DUF308 family)
MKVSQSKRHQSEVKVLQWISFFLAIVYLAISIVQILTATRLDDNPLWGALVFGTISLLLALFRNNKNIEN